MKEINVILVGFGVIGTGFAKSLIEGKKHLRSLGYTIRVKAICEKDGCVIDEDGLNLKTVLSEGYSSLDSFKQIKSLDVIRDLDADVMIEMTPGDIKTGGVGLKHILTALEHGKHVITSNKSPLVVDFQGLNNLALEKNLSIKYEATVCGAVPVINTCRNELKGNKIENVYGIFNGTTN